MSVQALTNADFQAAVMEAKKPVLIDFFATWCGPCRMVSPIVDEIAAASDAYLVYKVDVDAEPVLAQRFQVSSIPTLVVVHHGKVVAQRVGAQTKEEIAQMLTQA